MITHYFLLYFESKIYQDLYQFYSIFRVFKVVWFILG
ncbi:hypothetical protein CoNPh26_CDS0079 [Staphylococcus phage S-CoN_Ph26]|nr:hypothetical protein CoNPh26_CDS0079 [Staphylococcus phage S-CoN_Ph26]